MRAAYRRHDLVRLTPAAWGRIRSDDWDSVAGECIDHWAASGYPLVVSRQQAGMHQGSLQLGLPAPSRWQRRRLCLQVTSSDVASAEKFPSAQMIGSLLDVSMRSAWEDFVNGLGKLDIDARVYGSFGWQLLTGLSYVRPQSDIDLLMTVRSAYEADLLTTALGECGIASPRLDGEICFPDGSASAWREWQQWRSKASSRILVKRHDRAVLEAGDDWHALACAVPTSLCQ